MDQISLYPVIKSSLCGFINARADLVIDYKFDYAAPFSEGLAIVKDRGRYAWVDTEGRIIGRDTNMEFKELHAFRNGRAWVALYKLPPKRAMNFGFINRDGSLIVEGLANSREYYEGLAAVSRQGVDWGYIDVDGKEVVPEGKGGPNPFSEGVAVNNLGGKYSYIDKDGVPVIQLAPEVYHAEAFSDGLGMVLISKQGIAYVDHEGGMAIQLDELFDVAKNFYEGLAPVRREGLWGYINKKGELVISSAFREAGDFSGGLASVKTDDNCGYINTSGEFVIEPRFTNAYAFCGPLARIEIAGKLGYIDRVGEIVWKEE